VRCGCRVLALSSLPIGPLGDERPFFVQALLGDGAYALKVPALPWERAAQRAPA
jgi:hypothetical protein